MVAEDVEMGRVDIPLSLSRCIRATLFYFSNLIATENRSAIASRLNWANL